LGSKYSFPSSASIPPVSIMNAEPPLPKQATDAQPAQPAQPAILGTAPVPAQLIPPPIPAAPPPAR
jgi:hypothetical protein